MHAEAVIQGGTLVNADRSSNERRRRAFRPLVLSCVIFGLAAAAFAWTTLRVHDRQVSAENRLRDVASILSEPDVKSATQPVRDGGTLTAYYSPTLGKSAVVAHGLAVPPSGHTYELWYVDGAGGTPRPAGMSRFDAPQNALLLPSTTPLAARLELTVEPSGGSSHPTTPALATVPLG